MARDIDAYVNDITTIKRILTQHEDRVLLRPWAFFAWAAVVGAATLASDLVSRGLGWSSADVALRIWLPAFIVGCTAEGVGWLQYLRREEPAALTSPAMKLLLSFVGIATASCAVAVILAARGVDISAVAVLLIANFFFVFAVFSFRGFFLEAYALLFGGIALAALRLPVSVAYPVAGYGVALVCAAAGAHTRWVIRRRKA